MPDDKVYYDFTNGVLQGVYKGGKKPVQLSDIPMLLKGGSIIPMKTRYRRSSKLMKSDPYTLVIALDEEGSASGKLYVDDGETFAQGTEVAFTVDNNIINAKKIGPTASISFEKIIIASKDQTTTLNNPKLDINLDWSLPFSFDSHRKIEHDEL